MKMASLCEGILMSVLALSLSGCVTELSSQVKPDEMNDNLVVGRVLTTLTGERSRRVFPQVRFFELENQDTSQRYQIQIVPGDEYFAIDLPSGQYRLTRIQVSEGPFRSMADLVMTFSVVPGRVTTVGTWRVGIDSPRAGRMVVVSAFLDQAGEAEVRDFLALRYPSVTGQSIEASLLEPAQVEVRLYEVMPYPRYPRYFRRHWW